MKRFIAPVVLLGAGIIFASCSGGGSGGGFFASTAAPLLADASQQDLSGVQSSYQGPLGNGVTSTFPVVAGVQYAIRVDTTDSADEVTIDLWSDEGTHLKSLSRKSGETWLYTHLGQTQHTLMIVRPRNPLDDIDVIGIFTTANGPYLKTTVHVNLIVAGKFTGFGDPTYGDLTTTLEKDAFMTELMVQVNNLYSPLGIQFTSGRFSLTAAQVVAQSPTLIGPDEQALCSAGEGPSGTGFEIVNSVGLDAWAPLGFGVNEGTFANSHGINVFIVNHFTSDGTVGLSPRPGQIVGDGPDTALACAAFLQSNGTLTPRTPSQIATVLAHEIGHFLGLLHTTTFSPNFSAPTQAIDDGLADTPACTVLVDVNGDGMVGIGDGCQDEGNIMFYQAGNQVTFTNGQGTVMQTMLSIQEH